MKKPLSIIFLPIILFLTLFFSCKEVKKETSNSIASPVESKASFIPSTKGENSLSSSSQDVVKAKSFKKAVPSTEVNKYTNLSGKKIPFQELLKANISFTENKGQLERFENFYFPELDKVKFYSKAFCGTAYFATNGIGFGFQRGGLRDADFNVNNTPKEKMTKLARREVIGFSIEFQGCNKDAYMTGLEEQVTKTNFLKGNNPNLFITDILSFQKIKYSKLYKGIDLIYYNKENQLKYDYVVAPKADVSQIKMNYKNVKNLFLNKKGELEIAVEWGVLYDKKPYSYQIIKGVKKEVNIVYAKLDDKTIGFEIKGNYDKNKELVIDPFTVAWATYIGTATSDNGYIESTCIDNSSRVLGTGWTNNAFPVGASPNGYDKTYNNADDAYVFRLNAAGTAMDYVTYLGGSGNETGTGIAVNSAGDICVAGHTSSFLQTTFNEVSTTNLTVGLGNIIVNVANIGGPTGYGNPSNIMLESGGNIMYGTVYGFPNGTSLNVTITSIVGAGTFGTWNISYINASPFPTTTGSIQPNKTGNDGNDDIFYLKLNGSGNNLLYGTYYGGSASNIDWVIDMVLDGSDNAYITGRTQTTAGFATGGVYKTTAQGGYDGYVLKINSGGTLDYCTYIGGAGNDIGKGIVVTSTGEALVTGMTGSTGQGTGGVYQNAIAGGDDAFLLKLSTTGNIMFFTYLGGTSVDCGGGIELAGTNNEPIVVGTTASSNFPRVNPFDNTFSAEEAYVTRFNSNGSTVRYSSFIGGDGSDNTKGFDYTTVHKNAGIKVVAGKPVIVVGINSTPASMSSFLVLPVSYTAINQAGVTFTHNGATFGGGPLGDFFVTVLDSTAQTCQFGSFFGGTDSDYPTAGINILQSTGCVIFGGGVHSLPFPVTPGSFLTTRVNTTTPDQAAIVKLCLPEILPVELLNFNVKELNGTAVLNWSTSSEKNNAYFEIMKSTDGINYYSIGKVNGNGSVSDISNYSFTDPALTAGTTYYRLKQVDFNADFKFTDIRTINVQSLEAFKLLPNPGNGLIKFIGTFKIDATIEIKIQNMLEQQVYYSKDEVSKGAFEKEINIQKVSSGMYLVQIIAGNEIKTVKYIKE